MSDWLRDLGRRWQTAFREAKEQFQGPGPNMTLDREAVFVRCDRSKRAADVKLDDGAQRSIAPTWNRPPPDYSEVFVLLGEAGDGRKHVEVYINDQHIGTLTPTDSAEFLTILDSAKADSAPVVAEAVRDRDADGRWALHIYRPEQS